MISDVLENIKVEQERVLEEARIAKIVLELADPKRLQRASLLLKEGGVEILESTPSEVRGRCISTKPTRTENTEGEKKDFYAVYFKLRGSRVRETGCTCYDYQNSKNLRCKHILAVCAKWFLERKELWAKLNEARLILDRTEK